MAAAFIRTANERRIANMKITTEIIIKRALLYIGLSVAFAIFMFVVFALPSLISGKDCENSFSRVGEDTHSHQIEDGNGGLINITHCHADGDSVHAYSEND